MTQSSTSNAEPVEPVDLVESITRSSDIPHAWVAPFVAPDRWRAYALEHARRLVRDSNVVRADGAAVLWRSLAWDSRLLRVPSARIDAIVADANDNVLDVDVIDRAVAATLDATRAAGVTYLVARVATTRNDAVFALEGQGFALVDGLLTFGARLDGGATDIEPSTSSSRAFTIREATIDDAESVASLAASVYTTDRFHHDPMLDASAADDLYREWARNACLGTAADVVWIAESGGELLGFTTASVDKSTREMLELPVMTIGLVGTAAAARRRGVALALSRHALARAAEMGVAAVEVGTQLRNIAASRTYESAGFRLVATSLTLRHWAV